MILLATDEPARRIASYWDRAADSFDVEPDHGLRDPAVRAAWARLLRAWLPPSPADVLDFGCGTGSLALLAAEAGHRWAWSNAPAGSCSSRSLGRRRRPLALRPGGAERLPWPGGVTADRLSAALAPLVASRRVEPLQDPALWGHPVHDERYALIGDV